MATRRRGIQSFFSVFDRKFEYGHNVINVTVHVEGLEGGTAEGVGLLVLETLEAESEAREEMHLSAAGKAVPALLAISDVNILILHAQLTALTNQRL